MRHSQPGALGKTDEKPSQSPQKAVTRHTVECAALPPPMHEPAAPTQRLATALGSLLVNKLSENDLDAETRLLDLICERLGAAIDSCLPALYSFGTVSVPNDRLTTGDRMARTRENLFFALDLASQNSTLRLEKPADLLQLANHLKTHYSISHGFAVRPFSEQVRQFLSENQWQGSLRSLEYAVHRAVLLATGSEIGVEAVCLPDGRQLADAVSPSEQAGQPVLCQSRTPAGRTLADVERDFILSTLKRFSGNRTHAAKSLGLPLRTLRHKLAKYSEQGVEVPASAKVIAQPDAWKNTAE